MAIKAQSEQKRLELPNELLTLLVAEFNLWVEGNTDALNYHPCFSEWYSQRLEDSWFGSKGSPLGIVMAGRSIYLNLLDLSGDLFNKMIAKILSSLDSLDPTRIVFTIHLNCMKQLPKDRRILELASIKRNFQFPSDICILVGINKSSVVMDPISWPSLASKLVDWREDSQCNITIPTITDLLFRERIFPSHLPRVRFIQEDTQTSLYSFFESCSQLDQHSREIHGAIPASSTYFIRKITHFDQNLLLLGILPNQLRKIGKEHKMEHIEESLLLLSDMLFWEGFEIWKKRTALVNNYWKTIAPNEWKIGTKEKKSRGSRKMRLDCKNPFHFCTKHSDLSHQLQTFCLCSDTIRKKPLADLPDIRCFLTKYPKRYWNSEGYGHSTNMTSFRVSNHSDFSSREDLVRREHDRGQKKKKPRIS